MALTYIHTHFASGFLSHLFWRIVQYMLLTFFLWLIDSAKRLLQSREGQAGNTFFPYCGIFSHQPPTERERERTVMVVVGYDQSNHSASMGNLSARLSSQSFRELGNPVGGGGGRGGHCQTLKQVYSELENTLGRVTAPWNMMVVVGYDRDFCDKFVVLRHILLEV